MSIGNELADADALKEILDALEDEKRLSSKAFLFRVESVIRVGDIWRTTVEPENDRSLLDESTEGLSVTWGNPLEGRANILSVLPDESVLNLRFVGGRPPRPGSLLVVYPLDYLGTLLSLWKIPRLASESISWYSGIESHCGTPEFEYEPVERAPILREKQRHAYSCLQYRCSHLWGPPGTGKTFTVGHLLADFLHLNPTPRILLLSQTNSAIDLALLAVDDALASRARSSEASGDLRRLCKRMGVHFLPTNYVNRKHLLPFEDSDVLERLSACDARRPDPSDVSAYAAWKDERTRLEEEIAQLTSTVLDSSRLHAMTVTRAIYFRELLETFKYDLVIIDEASQVSLPQSLMLSTLGDRIMLAGDPRQLAPIVQSDLPAAEKWLRRSMFDLMKPTSPSTCMLDEQNRMAAPICRVVSRLFYEGCLKVARDCESSPTWHNARKLANLPELGSAPIYIHTVHQEGVPANPGWHRPNSLEFVCKTVRRIAETVPQKDILVVTPFRAQRHRIRHRLREMGLCEVGVSTVHRAQGSERHTVVFDPVRGGSAWMMSPEGTRLINVALSRAKARLVITLSRGDRANPYLDMIDKI